MLIASKILHPASQNFTIQILTRLFKCHQAIVDRMIFMTNVICCSAAKFKFDQKAEMHKCNDHMKTHAKPTGKTCKIETNIFKTGCLISYQRGVNLELD